MDFPTLLVEFPQRVTWETCFGSLWTAHLLDRVHPQCISVWSLQGHQGRLASVHCLPGNNYVLLDGSFCEYSDHFDKTIFGNITSIVESTGTSDRQVSVQGTPKAWSHDYHRESNHNSLPPRSREVIAHALGVLEEGVRHLSAHSVTPTIPRICPKTDDTDIGCSFGYDDDNNYDDVDDDDNYDCDNNH